MNPETYKTGMPTREFTVSLLPGLGPWLCAIAVLAALLLFHGCASSPRSAALPPSEPASQSDALESTNVGVVVSPPKELAPSIEAATARVGWISTGPEGRPLDARTSLSGLYDIIVIEKGELPDDLSRALRAYLENGGVVWTFDRAFGATWRNPVLLGGILPGADQTWEPPEEVMAMVPGTEVQLTEEAAACAEDVAALRVAGDHTMVAALDGTDIKTGLTTFDRALDAAARPLLKAQRVGRAVIGQQSFRPSGWVTVGLVKSVGKGQLVVLPSLDYSDPDTARFLGNLVRGCTSRQPPDPGKTSAPTRTVPAVGASWEAVAGSGDIRRYAAYVAAHPEHRTQIAALVEQFLQSKLAEAEGAGKRIVHNATTVPAKGGIGAKLELAGGEVFGAMFGVGGRFYSDPTDFLTIIYDRKGIQYVSGRGIAELDDTVYCFGF